MRCLRSVVAVAHGTHRVTFELVICGWESVRGATGPVTLEVDGMDGECHDE